MRAADVRECGAKGRDPKAALRMSLRMSDWACTALVDGVPVAMFGVACVSLIEGRGRPWMLGSEAIYANGRAMVSRGPGIVAHMHAGFRRLENVVSVDNHRSIRLLRWLGFTIGDEVFMVGAVPFVAFWKEVPDV